MEPAAPPPERVLLDVAAAAERLNVPTSYMYKLSSRRKITTYRVGGRLRFDVADLDAFVQRVDAAS